LYLYLTPVTIGAHKAVTANAIPKINIIKKINLSLNSKAKTTSHLPYFPPHISPGPFIHTLFPHLKKIVINMRTLFPNSTFFGLKGAHITGTTGGLGSRIVGRLGE
jgi:hypothetical protein